MTSIPSALMAFGNPFLTQSLFLLHLLYETASLGIRIFICSPDCDNPERITLSGSERGVTPHSSYIIEVCKYNKKYINHKI